MRVADTTVAGMLVNLLGEDTIDVSVAYAAAERANLLGLPVKWNARLRTAAGRCIIRWAFGQPGRARLIELSPRLIGEGIAALAETFLHELAHALAPDRRAPHGFAWKATARSIGSNGERCHDLASFSHNAARTVALCSGCDYKMQVARLTERRRDAIDSGTWKHKCGGTFYPASDAIRVPK